jgi:hypothetical protein
MFEDAIAEASKVSTPTEVYWFDIRAPLPKQPDRIVKICRVAFPVYREVAETFGYVAWKGTPAQIEAALMRYDHLLDPSAMKLDADKLRQKVISKHPDYFRWYAFGDALPLIPFGE